MPARRSEPDRDPSRRRRDRRDPRADRVQPGSHDAEPAWSPDGARLAFTAQRGEWYELRVIEVATGEERVLAAEEADFSEPSWHPDGSRIAAIRSARFAHDLVTVDAAAGGVDARRSRRCWGTPLWTADGAIVATYEDHATAPELRLVARGRGRDAASRRRRSRSRARRTSSRRRSASRRRTGSRSTRCSTARAPATRPVAGRRLPARRADRVLRRRVGRSRAVLRRQGLRVARAQLPRLDRAREDVRAAELRRLGRRRRQRLSRRGRLPAHARLGRRRAARDLRRELRLVPGALRRGRGRRRALPLRGLQVRRLRPADHVVAGRSRRRLLLRREHARPPVGATATSICAARRSIGSTGSPCRC